MKYRSAAAAAFTFKHCYGNCSMASAQMATSGVQKEVTINIIGVLGKVDGNELKCDNESKL